MPRVSQEHLAARREQVLAAGRRCFSRNGFHATSMQDVINEAGLSVGAVYRYFQSKDDLRTAVAEETVGAILNELSAVAQHDPPLPVPEAMERVVDMVESRVTGPDPVARLTMQAWSEALRDEDLAAIAKQKVSAIRSTFEGLARRAQQAGHLPPDTDPSAVGAVLMAFVPGYLVQRMLTGQPDRKTFVAGLHALLARPRTALPAPPSA